MNPQREILGGKNVVLEILKAGRRKVYKVFWARKAGDAKSEELKNLLASKNIPVNEVHPSEIANMTGSNEHQGVAAQVSAFQYAELEEVIQKAIEDKKGGFLVLLDEIQDPHNVGAIIRTAHQCGASGLILLKHRQVPITNAVCKAAAGAQEWLRIVKEVNLVNVINYLKSNNFFIYGSTGDGGESIFEEKFNFPIALLLGSEGRGLRRLVREHCDRLLTVPMDGNIDSLNVSVAAGIFMGQILCQRHLSP
ncbi:MAG: 23S rRNA (guanosine(2251)-2'-O)-methyltransferase RlmB [Deltaproteobacteria bacterium]|nr:23S rRNA (guanosine(2251)-2'-O)-methyltransferase RlmB [Deltaproteobacteria bacterium]